MMKKSVRNKIVEYKTDVVLLLSDRDLCLDNVERRTLKNIYELLSNALLDKLKGKRHSLKDILTARLMEYKIILSATRDERIMEFVGKLHEGIDW